MAKRNNKKKKANVASTEAASAAVTGLLPFLSGSGLTRVALFLTSQEREILKKVDARCSLPLIDGDDDDDATKKQQPSEQQHSRKTKKNEKGESVDGDRNDDDDDDDDKDKKNSTIYVVADPDTLLARLNTKRLFRRIKYLRNQKGSSAVCAESVPLSYYPRNKTTRDIAMQEWQSILDKAKRKEENSKETTTTTSTNRQPTNDDDDIQRQYHNLPSPYELLLFSPCPRPVTVLASFPRSGNSLLRNLFERTTLRVTGSDMRGGLTQHDLVGEAAVSTHKVQFVKTHFPERMGRPVFAASRAVLLVRNLYDALDSYFNLMMTNTHTTSLTDETRKRFEQVFEDMVRKEIHVWRMFHTHWLQKKIPILLIRYEDLIRYPDKVLARVIQFVLEINNMSFFRDRINRCVLEEQIENVGAYKPRSGGIGKSLARFSPDVLQEMNQAVFELMHKLGYAELLVPNPDEWKLPPIPKFGFELRPKGGGERQPAAVGRENVMVNRGPIVRAPNLQTDWKQIRKELLEDGSKDSQKK